MKFLESLRVQGVRYDVLASQCNMTETPLFADLCWGENLDVTTLAMDPGVEIDKGPRRFVLMRVAGELRYYAGPSDPYDEETEIDVGIFPNIEAALVFGYDWLIHGYDLSAIGAERYPRKLTG